jgi:hypothetical protein
MRTMETKQCAICERTLLVGELPLRFAPDGMDDYVDVCVLCQEVALDYGWVREGSPIGPAVRHARRRRPLSLAAIFGTQRRSVAEQMVAEPVLRRLSSDEQAQLEAATRFNGSDAVRTVDGISRSLGDPQASIVVLPGPNAEVVITIAWEISWYQYRVALGSSQPIRLAERGLEPGELDPMFTVWNARFEPGTGVYPDIQDPQ